MLFNPVYYTEGSSREGKHYYDFMSLEPRIYSGSNSTIESFVDLSAKMINDNAFSYYRSLKRVFFPECKYIGADAFNGCALSYLSFPVCEWIDDCTTGHTISGTGLTLSLPNCKYIGKYAFRSNPGISYLYLPECIYIGESAFTVLANIRSIDLPKCEYLGPAAFRNCMNLSQVVLSACKYVMDEAFGSNMFLSSIYLPNCEYLGPAAFFSCPRLTTLSLPNCKYIGPDAFMSCSRLTTLSLPNCEYIGSNAFVRTNLSYLYFEKFHLFTMFIYYLGIRIKKKKKLIKNKYNI